MKQSVIIGYDFTLRQAQHYGGSLYVYDTAGDPVNTMCGIFVQRVLGARPEWVTLRLRHRPFEGCRVGSCNERDLSLHLCDTITGNSTETHIVYLAISDSLRLMYPQLVGSKMNKSQKRFYWSITEA